MLGLNYDVLGKHAVFGRISKGLKIIKMIGLVETTQQDRPTQDVRIYSAYPADSQGTKMDNY